ncbi:MAG: TatD family hydrolase [Verrucomicrobia bacterium]|nr:TatD family hydrolase [Verrucomicrobiota bacterium]
MKAGLYDTHAHLDDRVFATDLEEVLRRAAEAGVEKIITLGVDPESSRRATELAERFPNIYAAVGAHPGAANDLKAPSLALKTIRELARREKVVAIGEIGMDFHWLDRANPPLPPDRAEEIRRRQADLFRSQLELAAELGLPCVIHQRDCFEPLLEVFRPLAGDVSAVFHCFVEPPERLQTLLALGAWVSFTGVITFKNARAAQESLRAVPADRYFLETDAPYLAPAPRRGKRCEPADLALTARRAAELRQEPLDRLAETLRRNAEAFFPRLQ